MLSTAPIEDDGSGPGRRDDRPGHHAHPRGRAGPAGSSPMRSGPCTRRSCWTRRSRAPNWPGTSWRRPTLLLGSDGSSIFLLSEDGSLRRAAGVGVPDPEGIDDLIAQAIGEHTAVVRHLPPEAASGSRGVVLLDDALAIRDRRSAARAPGESALRGSRLRRDGLHLRGPGDRSSDNRVRIARAFADQAALAIENARLQGTHRGDGGRSGAHAPRPRPARLGDAIAVRGEPEGGGSRRPAGRPDRRP